jgi:serine/threonine-protein kinase RsbT
MGESESVSVIRRESFPVQTGEDVVRARQAVREWAIEAGFRLVDQTKLVTAASELARNLVVHAGGGDMSLEALNDANRRGLRLVFSDEGPGIPDIELALKDGFTTGGGLGLGLGGAKRLVNEFEIKSSPGAGTRITLTQWK